MATVFVSHSAHGDKGAEPYLTRICTVLKDRHEVLLDRTGLQAGQYWNDIIINWMYMCDVAIILCSRKALESPYVFFEVSNLVGRLRRETAEFAAGGGPVVRVCPVLIPDLTFAELQKSTFAKFDFDQLHPLRPASADDLEQWLGDAIPETPACSPIVSELVGTVTDILKERSPEVLAAAAREASLVFRADTPRGEYASRLARHLAARNLLEVNRALRKLRPSLREATDRILQLLAPCWVSPEAALELKDIVEPQQPSSDRCAVINSEMAQFTPEMYLRRARGGLPDDVGTVVQLNPSALVRAGSQLRTELRREFAITLDVDEDDPAATPGSVEHALAERINLRLQAGVPVIAVLARSTMGEAAYYKLIDDLQAIPFLRQVTFIAVSGRGAPDASALRARQRLLHPPLGPDQENSAHTIYHEITTIGRAPILQRI